MRLTGKHETCDINTFRSGVADRGASIRIPLPVQVCCCGVSVWVLGRGCVGFGAWRTAARPSASRCPCAVVGFSVLVDCALSILFNSSHYLKACHARFLT